MLQIQHICKEYRTGNLIQKALDDVSLNLRDNEFVAILGPSGSGKTTLLNIIGGLDRYDSGDLIINGISTKKYKDRDWDSYRNHTIGFVFQSYNLIPHQTVLANVELALTISGIGKSERRKRATEALEKVGLGAQLHKRPSQMSGGQMQRVAIARALVNDPDILLADEPTGALDSDTSVQVMDLLQEVAKDRLVVMVTHNPELAEQYATRIVTLKDGVIRSDTDPFEVDETVMGVAEHRNMGKSSMSFLTALALSFNNLKTKKARTLLTSFAGSIGIIGIALILSLSTGVNQYIQNVEEETLSEYPLQIQSTGFDLTSMMVGMDSASADDKKTDKKKSDTKKKSKDQVKVIQMVTNMFSTMDSNDLGALKKYLDTGKSGVEQYTNAIEYKYSISPQIYKENKDSIRQVNPDQSFLAMGLGSSISTNSMMSSMMSTDVFYEMPESSKLYENQYEVEKGHWPEKYNECVVVLTSNGGMSDFMLYTLGLRDPLELDEMIQSFMKEENVTTPDDLGTYSYDDIIGTKFKLVNSSDYYEYDSQYQVWKDKTDNEDYMKSLVANGEDLTVVGIVKPAEDAKASSLSPRIAYPTSLTKHVAEQAAKSEIVKQQLANPDVNVFTNKKFGEKDSENEFSMDSLFTVDEAALQKAFGFDASAMNNLGNSLDFGNSLNLSESMNLSKAFQTGSNTLDLSGLVNLDSLNLDLSGMPQMNLGEIVSNLDLKVSPDGMKQMACGLLTGYQKYAKTHPEADYSGLGEDFTAFLKTDAAKKIISDNIKDIIKSSGTVTITTEKIQELIKNIMAGYEQYITEKGYTDPDQFDEYLMEYLQTDEAKKIISDWMAEVMPEDPEIEITPEQLEKLSDDLVKGYLTYASENGLPDPSKMGEHFMAYLQTDDGKKQFQEGLSAMIDMDQLESQVSKIIGNYMNQAMGILGDSIGQALETQISSAMTQIIGQMTTGLESAMKQMMTNVGTQLQNTLGNAMQIDPTAFADAFQMNMTEDDLAELMMSMSGKGLASYDSNLQKLGYVDFAVPSAINIYPKDFEGKEQVVKVLDDYNSRMEAEGKDEQVITYTDVVGTLMSSVTTIVDTISYVLIAFVAISLVVSSIMIGVITYISVLERKKEIGILRAIGASKRNVSQVFNAETFIIGLCAGVIGIGLTLLLLIPGNAIIHNVADNAKVNAVLPIVPAIILILLSVVLTLLGGLIPSKKAAKSDPVTALRTE